MKRQIQIAKALNVCLLAAAFATAIFTAYLFFEGYSPVPVADTWTVFMAYQGANFHITLRDLLAFHNEHRPLFARVPILIDTIWLGERAILPFALIFLTQAVHAWLLIYIARKEIDKRQTPLIVALAIFCCFSPAQMENFIWSFQTAFVFNFLFATAALAAVAAQKETGSVKWAALVTVCACGAPLCLASGVLVWWLVAAMAIAVRLPRNWILAYFASAVLTVVLYIQGFPSTPNKSVFDTLRDPLGILHYVMYFIGWSWKSWTIQFGELMLLPALALMTARIVSLVRTKTPNPWDAVPAGVMLFSLGTGLLAALGRLNYGLDQAGSSRYETPALLFWFMAALLTLSWLPKGSERAILAFGLFVLVAILSIFPASRGVTESVRHRRIEWDVAGAAWTSGVQDEPSLNSMMAGPQLDLRSGYQEHHLGWFSGWPGSELGSRLAPERIEFGSFCEGSFQRSAFATNHDWPGVRLTGSGRVSSTGKPIYHFLTTTSDLRIVGVGAAGAAFASVRQEREPVIVYGLLDDGKVCAIRVNSP